jgi:hypothetical protein
MSGFKFLLALAVGWSCIHSGDDEGRSIWRQLENHRQLVVVERDQVVVFVKGGNSASKPFWPEHNLIGWNVHRRRTDRRSSPGRCSWRLVLNWIGVQPGQLLDTPDTDHGKLLVRSLLLDLQKTITIP